MRETIYTQSTKMFDEDVKNINFIMKDNNLKAGTGRSEAIRIALAFYVKFIAIDKSIEANSEAIKANTEQIQQIYFAMQAGGVK